MKILYITIDGKVSGGNTICKRILHAAKKAGNEVELLSPDRGAMTDGLEKEGVTLHFVPLTRSFRLDQAVKLARILRKNKIDLVHTHTCLNSEILARIACCLVKIPIICHQHDPADVFNANSIIAGYQRRLDKMTSRYVYKFIAVADSRRGAMINYRGYPRDKVKLIYNGIKVESFGGADCRASERERLNLAVNDKAIGLIGRLETAKGQETLLRSAPAVARLHPDTKFFIIGDDHVNGKPSLARCKELISRLKLENTCFLLGFRPNVRELIQAMDIIVLPSLWEAHSLVILEALAAKKPVIASKVGGTPEIITNETEGILVPPGDPESLTREICRVIEDPDLVQKITANGYEKVKEEFSEKRMLNKVFALYEEVRH